jgi:hypothetical protein
VSNPTSALAGAGRWFLCSGIQSPEGGVARYYRSDLQKNHPVSTEITGYAASALSYLYEKTGESAYADRALHTARFLTRKAWDASLGTFPFEYPGPSPGYFFDCGIIVRGLLSVWRFSHEQEFLDAAVEAARAMLRDFDAGADFHPIIELPSKQPAARTAQWSKTSGCYQLKAALGWHELAEVTGDAGMRRQYERVLDMALRTEAEFLPGDTDEHKVMDRLHAYCYMLEALLADGIDVTGRAERVSLYLHEIAPRFVRSDVYAQLARMRMFGRAGLDCAALEVAELKKYQITGDDLRVNGGFYFGRKDGKFLPYVNPVSTAFAMQALQMWQEYQAGTLELDYRTLI